MTVAGLYGRLLQRGIELSCRGDRLRYAGPERELTPETLDLLRRYKVSLRDHIRCIQHRVAVLHKSPVAELIGHLAAAGFYFRVIDEWPHLRANRGADPDAVDEAVVDALVDREEELVTWLQTPFDDLPCDDQRALDYDPNRQPMEARKETRK